MDSWIISATKQRRDELLLEASHVRLQRLAVRGRPNAIRGRIADGALTLSALLVSFAQAMRA
ncbi:MAG: hypothetical protein M3N19_11760 [Candidatus Eremiobacteraeota bacterium]|nr:hypothetical protein [Candidatus Eremiobacteraeota bacterium]